MDKRTSTLLSGALFVAGFVSTTAYAGPWTFYPTVNGPITAGVPLGPIDHPGKEYMWEVNRNANGTVNPGQVIAWDGAGGVQNSQINYGVPNVDALANIFDAYFDDVVANRTALLYSERTNAAWGQARDTRFPVYYETTGGLRDGWATRQQVNQDWIPLEQSGEILNLIGLEVFGPNDPNADDAYMFSVNGDVALLGDGVRYSIYSYNQFTNAIGGYVPVQTLAAAVGIPESVFDLDALMVADRNLNFIWDAGDSVLFSAMPFDGYIGDAAYVLDFGGPATFLNHGGHLWTNGWLGTNVDALEAAIPEPESLALLGVGLLALFGVRNRRV